MDLARGDNLGELLDRARAAHDLLASAFRLDEE